MAGDRLLWISWRRNWRSRCPDVYKRQGKGVTVSFDMSGAPVAQHNAILVTGKMGRVVFLGISHKGLELSEQAVDNILRYQLAIKGSRCV